MSGVFPNRTPLLHLNYGAEAADNFNWSRIDETIANAFGPDSPLQLPPGLAIPPSGPAGGMLDGMYPNPIVRVRLQLLAPFSGANTWNSVTWQQIATLGPFISRGGPIMLAYNLNARLRFTAQPAGTMAFGRFGWGLMPAGGTPPTSPGVWTDTFQATLVGSTGGTVVEVPLPPSTVFDQEAAGGFTYYLFVSVGPDATVSVVSNGGRAWLYELA